MAQVVLLAILYESHAWRQTVWHVVDEAVVVESKVCLPPRCCSPLVLVPQLQPPYSSSHFALPCAGVARPHEGLHRSLPEVAPGLMLHGGTLEGGTGPSGLATVVPVTMYIKKFCQRLWLCTVC